MARSKSKPTQSPSIEVDIVSDFVCPWCWLGYKLFLKAAQQSQKETGILVKLSWRPYMLDPSLPKDGADYKDYMKKKFGEQPDNKFAAMREHLEKMGPDLGIAYDFDAIKRRPNTLDAHRLMRWAQGQGLGAACADQLFIAFMEKGSDIGDLDVLTAIADDIGLDADMTRGLLETDKDTQETEDEIKFFRDLGISGVPTFIYNGQFAVQGAQGPDAHLNAMKQAIVSMRTAT